MDEIEYLVIALLFEWKVFAMSIAATAGFHLLLFFFRLSKRSVSVCSAFVGLNLGMLVWWQYPDGNLVDGVNTPTIPAWPVVLLMLLIWFSGLAFAVRFQPHHSR